MLHDVRTCTCGDPVQCDIKLFEGFIFFGGLNWSYYVILIFSLHVEKAFGQVKYIILYWLFANRLLLLTV